jgi:hypothetical protein
MIQCYVVHTLEDVQGQSGPETDWIWRTNLFSQAFSVVGCQGKVQKPGDSN